MLSLEFSFQLHQIISSRFSFATTADTNPPLDTTPSKQVKGIDFKLTGYSDTNLSQIGVDKMRALFVYTRPHPCINDNSSI